MGKERWLPIPGFERAYEVSDRGRVRSIDRVHTYERIDQYSGRVLTIVRRHRGRILRPATNANDGHMSVVLGRAAGSKGIHTLVLRAFVGPPPEGHECCHRDDDPSNNKLSNLRWGTRSDNLHDAVRNGKKPVGERHAGSKLTTAIVKKIRPLFGRITYVELGRRYGVSDSTIRQIKDGRTWTHVK